MFLFLVCHFIRSISEKYFSSGKNCSTIEDGSLAGGDGVELRSASEEGAEETNSGENDSGSR